MTRVFNFVLDRLFSGRINVAPLVVLCLLIAGAANAANAQAINEGFESVAALPAAGWFSVNHSSPLGPSVWSQCAVPSSGAAIPPAQAGTSLSCAIINFDSTGDNGTISNWLLGPNRTFKNGDTISFYTRTISNSFPDRLQLRLSTNGSSTNVGTLATDVGDFTTLLVDIDADYSGTYPTVWTQFTATLSGLPAAGVSGRFGFRYFVEDGGLLGNNSNIIGLDTVAYTPAAVPPANDAPVDINGDGKSDFVVIRNTGGGINGQATWFTQLNGGNPIAPMDWGIASDQFIPADFDGDGKDDYAIFRPGAQGKFYIVRSFTNTIYIADLGTTGDDATVVGDYTGDNVDDLALYRAGANPGDQSFWYYRSLTSTAPFQTVAWGQNGDFPAPGDYDGDGKYDFVVQRPDANGVNGRFFIRMATGAQGSVIFGLKDDTIVPGDYDGDGKTDLAVLRDVGGFLQWDFEPSGTAGITTVSDTWGVTASDFVAQGDYDGDGKTDYAVWRLGNPGTFFMMTVGTRAITTKSWGGPNDFPAANYNEH